MIIQRLKLQKNSYTTKLFKDGINKIAQKVGEEALETVIEAANGTNEGLVYETADLLYHLLVLLTYKDIRLEDIVNELQKRHNPEWDKKPDIKWNFTKFIIDRNGNVVARFEPTADMTEVEACIKSLL